MALNVIANGAEFGTIETVRIPSTASLNSTSDARRWLAPTTVSYHEHDQCWFTTGGGAINPPSELSVRRSQHTSLKNRGHRPTLPRAPLAHYSFGSAAAWADHLICSICEEARQDGLPQHSIRPRGCGDEDDRTAGSRTGSPRRTCPIAARGHSERFGVGGLDHHTGHSPVPERPKRIAILAK